MIQEEETVEVLFKAHYNAVHRFLLKKLGSLEDAEDAAQETFTRMAGHVDTINLKSPKAYLFRIAYNLAGDMLRSRAVRSKYAKYADVEAQPSKSQPPDASFEMHQRQQQVEKALAELPPRCREVFMLHRFENLTYRKIAKRLDISPKTVENHIARAILHLRKRLSPPDH